MQNVPKESKNREYESISGDIVLCDLRGESNAGVTDSREILPTNDRFLNMLVIGPTGCGKSLHFAMSMITQDIRNRDWGVTVFDPKGDLALKTHLMAQHLGRKSLHFDPSFSTCPKFNPLAGREDDVLETISEAFRLMNPDSPRYYLDLNDLLLRNAIKVLKRLDRAEGVDGKYASLAKMNRLLYNFGGEGKELISQFIKINNISESEASENRDIVQWFLFDYFPEHSKTYADTSGVRSQLNKLTTNHYLREILNPDFEKGEKSEIDFDRILADGDVICISTARGILHDMSKYLGFLLNLTLQASIRHRYNKKNVLHPHTLYLDEFAHYAVPSFVDILSLSRPCRVSSVLAVHSRAEMGLLFGKKFVNQVLTRTRNIILYHGASKKDFQYFSNQLGFLPRARSGGVEYGGITYSIVKNGSVQPTKSGMVKSIPAEFDKQLNLEVLEHEKKYKCV